MTDWRCSRCEEWYEGDGHDPSHYVQRQVEALERIAENLDKFTRQHEVQAPTYSLRVDREPWWRRLFAA